MGRSGKVARKKATHRVACAVCGKEGDVELGRGGKIADKSWSFFGRFSVNYEAAMSVMRLETPDFSRTEPVPVEYWECESCHRDVEQILENER